VIAILMMGIESVS